MNRTSRHLIAAVALTVMAAAACTSGSTNEATNTAPETPPSSVAVGDETEAGTGDADSESNGDSDASGNDEELAVAELDPELTTMVANLAEGYEAAKDAWAGFVPNDHPGVVVVKDGSGAVTKAIALNHPDPEKLGDATAVSADGLPFKSIHQVTDPVDADAMTALDGFDFHASLGGVDSFAMIATPDGDQFFDPTQKDYVSTWLHEMFHRYQDEAFGGTGGQDVEGYAYTPENLELAVLEERALSEAVAASDVDERRSAASRVAAIRLARLAADDRVELDNDQEMIEGSARYIEHRLAGPDSGYIYHSENHGDDLVTDFGSLQGIKEHFGFGRWYASGAAILHLLDELEVENVAGRVEAGESPAEILAAELEITTDNMSVLVDEARADYDPPGDLAAAAADAAKKAESEPPVFGDQGESGADGEDAGDGGGR